MRFVSVDNLTEGMILGKPFYGNLGAFLLRKHAVLTDSLINKIRELGYLGLYITDNFSEGIEPDFVVSDELRTSMASSVRTFMSNLQSAPTSDSPVLVQNIDSIMGMVKSLVDEIVASKSAVVNIIDLKSYDLYTYQHSVNVSVLSGVLGSALKMTRSEITELASAAIFHDIGKMFIPKEVLDKPGALDDMEFAEMKKHPALGAAYIKEKLSFGPTVYLPVGQHHERYDGLGYPLGLSGKDIGVNAQIIAMTDTFDAITSKRPYHDAIMPHEGCEYIMGNAGSHFAPNAVELFFRTVAAFPVGVGVRLSNGAEGIVYKNYSSFPMRPMIKLKPKPGQRARFLDLCHDPSALNITVQRLV